MATGTGWTRQQLLVAFALYCELPFGKLHSRNPRIVQCANLLGRTPSALAMKLTNIASIDPVITQSGRKGLSGASAADRSMWNEMQEDWPAFAVQSHQAFESFGVQEVDQQGDAKSPEPDYVGMSKKVLVNVRIGQALFRRSVLSAYRSRCCISGISSPRFLVASHIVPWRTDSKHRLNPRNGLCLSVLHDRAFDAGLITLSKDLTVLVSRQLKSSAKRDPFLAASILSFDRRPVEAPEKFYPSEEFLEFHRQKIFQG